MLECYQCVAVLISLHCAVLLGVWAFCVWLSVSGLSVLRDLRVGLVLPCCTRLVRGSGLFRSALPTLPIQWQMEILCGQMKVIFWFLEKVLCKVLYGSDGLQ